MKKTQSKKVKTFVRRSFGGDWQAGFTIGVQTFFLQPCEADPPWSSKKKAGWYQKCLNDAFKNVTIK